MQGTIGGGLYLFWGNQIISKGEKTRGWQSLAQTIPTEMAEEDMATHAFSATSQTGVH